MLKNLKIVRLFTAIVAGFWIAFLALACGAWWGLTGSAESLEDVHDNHMVKSEALAKVSLAIEGARLEVMRAFQHDPTSPLSKLHDHPLGNHLKAMAQRDEQVRALWDNLKAGATEADELKAVEEALRLREAWEAKLRQTEAALNAGNFSPPVMNAFLIAGRTEAQALTDALARMRDWHSEGAAAAAAAAQSRKAAIGWTLLLLGVGVCLPGTVLCIVALNRLRLGLAEANAVTEAVAHGDLSVTVRSDGRDEIGQLLARMGHMREHLADVIGQVRQVADSIGTASAQVAAGNADLSHRTENTAGNLQQTAASTEQLGATVRQNATHAQQASSLATEASGVAGHGGEAVSQVVSTMRQIHQSSQKIAEIIGVIDGIAFQTNILALNAAVEAARAGEQGRGFAVVAGEVRSLAQRSAEAAREIKSLIQSSVERVDAGTRQADDAGRTMEAVVASIQRVSQIVTEISQASAEQSHGVAEVSAAVTQMDQATQQNAALVEESAAAAESLNQQARQLVQAVARFRLDGSGSAHAA